MATQEMGVQLLQSDLQQLEDRLRDEKFATELYRALAGNRWTKEGQTVALSWKRAEELINDLRRGVDRPALELDQTGREGEVSDTVRDELERLGWQVEPLDTGTHDPTHVSSAEDPPPPKHGERMAPPEHPAGWSGVAEREGQSRRGRSKRR
jgi:hypothetical protein